MRNSVFIAAVHKFQGHNGYICGGYSEVPWKYDNGNGKYSQSSRYLMPDLIRLGRRPSAVMDFPFLVVSCLIWQTPKEFHPQDLTSSDQSMQH